MAQQEPEADEITMSNTKKEMLAAYKEMVKRLQEKREAEMKPEQKIEEKERGEAVRAAESLSTEGIGKEIGNLKSEIGKMLVQLSDKMEEEIGKYTRTKKAVEAKVKELEEIYEIEKSASTFTALLEAQQEKRRQFETQMAEQKEKLEREIQFMRQAWKQENEAHDAEIKERDDAEKKRRAREAEEYKYKFEREKQLAGEQFEYEKAKLDRQIDLKKEELEGVLAARERALSEREAELNQLRARAEAFPMEMEAAINKAVKETTDSLNREARTSEELMKRDFQGEQNVLNSRIESLQRTVKEQSEQIAKLAGQIERSYGQVQDIAVKAIEGSSNAKAFAAMQARVSEPSRRSAQEEK